MSGNQYQLRSNSQVPNGCNVAVNGPYDTYGYVIKSDKEVKDGRTTYLHLVRGTGKELLDAAAIIYPLG